MADIIKELDASIEAQFGDYKQKWLEHGLSTQAANRPLAERAIENLYRQKNLARPDIVWAKSPPEIFHLHKAAPASHGRNLAQQMWGYTVEQPLAAIKKLFAENVWQQLADGLWESKREHWLKHYDERWPYNGKPPSRFDRLEHIVSGIINGSSAEIDGGYYTPGSHLSWLIDHSLLRQTRAGDLARLFFCSRALGLKSETNATSPLWTLFRSAGWVFPFEKTCFVSERPSSVTFNQDGFLHNEAGPSLTFLDGFSVSCWHNVVVPHAWTAPEPQLSIEDAFSQRDILKRLIACEILGWEHVLSQFQQTHINRPRNRDPKAGELFSVDLPEIGTVKFLRYAHGGKQHVDQVPSYETKAIHARSTIRRTPRVWMRLKEWERR